MSRADPAPTSTAPKPPEPAPTSAPSPRTPRTSGGDPARFFFVAGALAAGLAVALGAFGAHALQDLVSPNRISTFETGARYQMYHALALLFAGWATGRWPGRAARWSGYLFAAGIVLFSGSLYALVLTDTPWLGAVAPLGGLAFIAGWLLLAWGAWRGTDV